MSQLHDLEQYTRKYNLKIHGIAETTDENIAENIIKLGKVVKVHISPNDIDICHRMETRYNIGPKPIIVRFKSHKKKSELFKAKKHLKSVSLSQYFHATNVVYINENLMTQRRKLFAIVRKFKKDNHWESAWTIDGKIFIKKSRQDQPKRILAEEDLRNIVNFCFFRSLVPILNPFFMLIFSPTQESNQYVSLSPSSFSPCPLFYSGIHTNTLKWRRV